MREHQARLENRERHLTAREKKHQEMVRQHMLNREASCANAKFKNSPVCKNKSGQRYFKGNMEEVARVLENLRKNPSTARKVACRCANNRRGLMQLDSNVC